MFFEVWNMILTFFNQVISIEFFPGLPLYEIVLAFFGFVAFIRFIIYPILGGKVI